MEVSLDPERRRINVRLVGDFTLEEILDGIARAVSHPDFEPGFDILSDHTLIERAIETDELTSVAERMRDLAPVLDGGRMAVVVSRPASLGMMHMMRVVLEDVLDVRVFPSVSDAEVWLARPRSTDDD